MERQKTNLIYNLYLDRRPYPDTPCQIQFTSNLVLKNYAFSKNVTNSYSWSKERMA